jgi:Ni/Co efflux regulator RcnB
MKNSLLHLALAFSVMAGMVALTAQSSAQQTKADPQAAAQQAQPQNEAQTQDAKPFNGTIVKEKGKLMLKDSVSNVSYQLDDQDKAKQFLGKQVKVTGKLDMNTNVIHVDSIEPLAS